MTKNQVDTLRALEEGETITPGEPAFLSDSLRTVHQGTLSVLLGNGLIAEASDGSFDLTEAGRVALEESDDADS